MTEELLLNAHGLYTIYEGLEGAANVVALRGLSLTIEPGEFVSVVGTSGAGKSTLLRTLGGLQKPNAGTIKYYGREITKLTEDDLVPFRRSTIGFIFQEGNLIPELSAFDNVVMTLRYAEVGFTESRKRADQILSKLGMKSRMHDLPHRLSGGEQQRVAIARALANNPKLILADEPTGNLDYQNTENVMELFRDLHNDLDTAFLIVTHSQHVASYADRNVELSDGMIIGQHGAGSDIYELEESRSVIINKSGNLTLPPELLGLLDTYGDLWDVSLDVSTGTPKIVATPTKVTVCPVCKAEISKNDFACKSCGAKIQ
ncbi:MAG: ABC transporter ATP-binding protein [Candidatus Heimdallarchaeota archaeon]|nr:ABC transporter ATP-binding protein [Candidatus Heimdallarchaeota archaeon]